MQRPLVTPTRRFPFAHRFALALLAFALMAVATAQTNITFWHTYSTGSGEEQTMLEQVIPRFQEEHPDIRVEAVGFPYDDFRQKLLTAFAGGIVPDLVRMDIIWVPEFADMGALERLDGHDGFEALAESVFPGPLSTNFWDGGYFGLPLDTNTQVMLYDVDAVGTPPATFEEFVAYLEENGDASADRWGFAVPGPAAWYVLPWIWSNGGAVTDEAITTAQGYLNGPATVGALEMLVDLYERGLIAPTFGESGIGTWEGLGGGQYLAIQDGPWAYPSIHAQYPDRNLAHAPMPAGPGGSVSIVGGEDIVMFADSTHKDAAWAFLEFLLSPWAQITMASTGQIPVIQAALEDPYILEHPFYGVYLEQLQTAKARTPHPAWTRIEEAMQNAFQRVIMGDATAQQALDEAAQLVDQYLR
ncbi:MAG: extracellular solute-binding protein [Trueperaceae bacterium]